MSHMFLVVWRLACDATGVETETDAHNELDTARLLRPEYHVLLHWSCIAWCEAVKRRS